MTWSRKSIVYPAERAQLPVVSHVDENRFIVNYSIRNDKGFSVGVKDHFEITSSGKLNFDFKPRIILEPGQSGSTDVAGTMPMQLIDDKLFYIGWTIREDVPYFNYASVAINEKKQIKKLGPILSPDTVDNGYSGTLFAIKNQNEDLYFGYYLSSTTWEKDENNDLQPCYDLKIAKSVDLINWIKTGKTAINLIGSEKGHSAASVIRVDDIWHMWFSTRGGVDFRGGDGSYQINHAWSNNLIDWNRTNLFGLSADTKNGENMCSYPSVFEYGDMLYLFYNGRSFGLNGISLATMPKSTLQKLNFNAEASS